MLDFIAKCHAFGNILVAVSGNEGTAEERVGRRQNREKTGAH